MISNYINIVGLVLDIIGVIIVFIHGIAPDTIRKGTGADMLNLINTDIDSRDIHKAYSKIGLVLIVLGFFFQIIGNVYQLLHS